MRDLLLKLRILWEFVSTSFGHWKHDVWDRDLDAQYCCDGRECGCMGLTFREMYTMPSDQSADVR